jgi:adenine-specific DNA-methyltransferase
MKDVLAVIRNTKCVFLEGERVVRGVDTSPSTHEGKGVFVLSTSELEAMQPMLNKHELALIKPFYEANQIDAYRCDSQNHYWLIYTDRKNRESIEKNPKGYPTIVAHLNSFKEHITSDNKPYGLHRAKDINQFLEKTKIVFVRKTPYPKFTVVEHDFFCDESVFYILPSEDHSQLFLISVLNSKIAFYWFFKHKTQGKQLQIDKEIVLSLPIPKVVFNAHQEDRRKSLEKAIMLYNAAKYDLILSWAEKEISESRNDTIHDFLAFLAKQLISLKSEGKEHSSSIAKEQEQTAWLIDQIVYKLYGLTEEEVKIVEGMEK